jgi:transglutaminase-like putative cysteine protease
MNPNLSPANASVTAGRPSPPGLPSALKNAHPGAAVLGYLPSSRWHCHSRRLFRILLCLALLSLHLTITAQPTMAASLRNTITAAEQLELKGDFATAAALLKNVAENPQASAADRHLAAFELDRLDRIRRDYPLTREALLADLKNAVEDLDDAEFDRWVAEGRFDSRTINGQVRFMSSSVSNLFFRYSELEPRRIPQKDVAALELARLQTVSAIKTAARAAGTPYVLPKHLEATMTVTVRPDVTQPGDLVRAWLPVPRAYPFQTGFKVVNSSPAILQLGPETSPIRSAYFEQKASAGIPTSFTVTYRFTTHGVHFDLDPARVRSTSITPDLKPFIQEAPHVVFTPELRALAKTIAGSESNPLLRAKRYYDWIGQNIKYSYATEYSTIRNISHYCLTNRYGDCGQIGLLFISLCRVDGIPARWQSGWNLFPGAKTIHDWAEIYIAPYGWFPVDPYMSTYAHHYIRTLTDPQKREIGDFYFGGLDQYRMSANSDHNQHLTPAKNSFRSDDVDFQRGEVEAAGKNIYFNGYGYELLLREIEG